MKRKGNDISGNEAKRPRLDQEGDTQGNDFVDSLFASSSDDESDKENKFTSYRPKEVHSSDGKYPLEERRSYRSRDRYSSDGSSTDYSSGDEHSSEGSWIDYFGEEDSLDSSSVVCPSEESDDGKEDCVTYVAIASQSKTIDKAIPIDMNKIGRLDLNDKSQADIKALYSWGFVSCIGVLLQSNTTQRFSLHHTPGCYEDSLITEKAWVGDDCTLTLLINPNCEDDKRIPEEAQDEIRSERDSYLLLIAECFGLKHDKDSIKKITFHIPKGRVAIERDGTINTLEERIKVSKYKEPSSHVDQLQEKAKLSEQQRTR